MEKVSITLDLTKIDKNKITNRVYKDKDGVEHTAKEYKVDLVPLKVESFVTEGSWGKMFKTHFVAQAQTKDERAAKAPTVYVGNGFRFETAAQAESPSALPEYREGDDVKPEDIPF